MKSIVSTRTLHVPAKTYKPVKIDPVTGGHLESGVYDVDEITPGVVTSIDADEADRLVTKYPDFVQYADPAPKPTPVAKPPVT